MGTALREEKPVWETIFPFHLEKRLPFSREIG